MRIERVILGIDPGIRMTGYGLIRGTGENFQILDFGRWRFPVGNPLFSTLKSIYEAVSDLIQNYNPDWMAVESIFYSKNVKTALSIGQARGVAILAGINAGLRISEYSPLEVKQAVVGRGGASKVQVQYMVKRLLGLKEPPSEDAADALAIAICHLQKMRNLD